MPSNDTSRFRLFGFSPLAAAEIFRRLESGEDVAALPGDFVAVDEGDSQSAVVIATSALSAVPYFYAMSSNGKRLVHGTNVFDCARELRSGWRWNDRAVHCLALFQHTLADDTLHADIHRVPPASVLTFRNGKLDVRQSSFWERKVEVERAFDVGKTVRLVNEITAGIIADRQPFISLSAGFDSRVLLSSVLALGARPIVGTMGSDAATDVKVAGSIARQFSLEHRIVRLKPEDYLKYASGIVRLTSGTKTADHWHTYLFARGIGTLDRTVHLAGSNGEFVRSYYFDKGILASASQWAPRALAEIFLRLKDSRHRRIPVHVTSGVLSGQQPFRNALRLMSDSLHPAGGWLNTLDNFYSLQRVRHFIGNGLALYNSVIPTASPFLDCRFIAMSQRMPRRLKLSSRFHRQMIIENMPALLDFPADESGVPMRNSDRPGYWIKRRPTIGFNMFGEFADSDAGKSIIIESSHLDRFLDRRAREAVCQRKLRPLAGLLICLHFTSEEVQKLEQHS